MKDLAEKLVTVGRFSDYIGAELARQLLADHGITAVVLGDNAANAYAGLSAIADVQLQTLDSHASQARQILESSTEKEL